MVSGAEGPIKVAERGCLRCTRWGIFDLSEKRTQRPTVTESGRDRPADRYSSSRRSAVSPEPGAHYATTATERSSCSASQAMPVTGSGPRSSG